ncbi:M23 family metallopeptidase [Flavobacterium sp.]|uniref:M23 family metallopeptidase n=1 Tax=Flavobacterium sp. TaxID=239 RepID=UPI00286DCC56|nr:M23 family metallopeptidase [Flavobacterium sp.]
MKKRKKITLLIITVLIVGFLFPENFSMPVENATKLSYNQESFWYYPWGKSVTHKGVDVFAKQGTKIHSATNGFVLYSGKINVGGNVVLILSPKWRLHYYAHLKEIEVSKFSWVNPKKIIGTVGATGNAVGKSPHLHYSIVTLIPYIWKIDNEKQGWKKMFYLNPIDYLNQE